MPKYKRSTARRAKDTSKRTVLDRQDYTIGWICAIHPEYVAAAAVLEETHPNLDGQSNADRNSYTLGSIGGHNIVIASLPEGEYGESSATRVADDMLHSFPNVRLGLLVGIGGGAPHGQHDVRLGDIVVSTPRGCYGGVIQYDHGKNIQDQEFQLVGSLNKPPAILRSAVGNLHKDHTIDARSRRYDEKIDKILKRRGMGRDTFGRPDTSPDRLYRSDFVHPKDKTPCEECCGDDATRLQERKERTEEDGIIQVHYGLIASANTLLKDAKTRDKLSEERDVLCFEMEAAGLMNGFPCLVIRGICDYADSHKNKKWQGYAAMAAATYARDLLERVPLQRVLGEEKIKDILATISKDAAKAAEDTSRVRSVADDYKSDKILNWITATDYSPHFTSCMQVHQAGTGNWFLNSSEFKKWHKGNKQTLLCQGIPGAGKSILASVVIKHILDMCEEDKSIGIAYVYCIFQQKERQSKQDLLASLVKQLARARSPLPDSIKAMYKEHEKTQTPLTFDELLTALSDLVGMYSKVFIIVDALDECQAGDGEGRTVLLDLLFKLQGSTATSIFATSRHNLAIEQKFHGRSTMVEIKAQKQDIELYLEGQMPRISLLDVLPEEKTEKCKADIKSTIVSIANGMFLLAKLHFESLTDKTSVSALLEALRTLPNGDDALHQAYAMTIARIKNQKPGFRHLAERVLTLLCCAQTVFTALELSEALAVQQGDKELDDERKEMPTIMVSVCAGLVTIDGTDMIRLVHETTREYLVKHMCCIKPSDDAHAACDATTNDAAMKEAHKTMAIICLTYLSFKEFDGGYVVKDDVFKVHGPYPFFIYALSYWHSHVDATTKCKGLGIRYVYNKGVSAVTQLLQGQPPTSMTQAKRAKEDASGFYVDIAIHLVPYIQFYIWMLWLLRDKHDTIFQMNHFFTALYWTTFYGNDTLDVPRLQYGTLYQPLRISRHNIRLAKVAVTKIFIKYYHMAKKDISILDELDLKEINEVILELAAINDAILQCRETCRKSIEQDHNLQREEETPLHIATEDGDIVAIKRLLEEEGGASLECANRSDYEPLLFHYTMLPITIT